MSRYQWLKTSLSAVIILGMAFIVFSFPKLTPQAQFIVFIIFALIVSSALLFTLSPITRKLLFIFSRQNHEIPIEDKPSILIVDDNTANRRILREMLDIPSLTIIEANSGKEALSFYPKYDIRLIFMDIEMQGMNGIDASRIIRTQESIGRRTPIIATSAHNSRDKILMALAAGFDDYLIKPIDIEQLKMTTHRWLSVEAGDMKEGSIQEVKPPPLAQQTDSTPAIIDVSHNVKNTSEETTKKVVDIKKSLIYSHNNRDLAKDMLTMLITMVSKEKNNMMTFFQQEEWDKLGELAHKLNGGSCYCGVPELQKYAKILDESVENGSLDIIKQTFPKLIEAMDDLLAWQEEYDIDVIFDI